MGTSSTVPGRGRKQCPACKLYVGVRSRICPSCSAEMPQGKTKVLVPRKVAPTDTTTPPKVVTVTEPESRKLLARIVTSTPAGRCPCPLNEFTHDAIKQWVTDICATTDEYLTDSALRYWANQLHPIGTTHHKELLFIADVIKSLERPE